MIKNIYFRIFIGIFVPVVFILLALFLYNYGSPFECVTFKFWGIYCTGCGAGRAGYDLVHLNILNALNHNALFTIFLPFIGYYLLKVYIKIVFRKDILPFFNISVKLGYTLVIVIVLFTITRNIPIFPFTLLAP